MNGRVSAKVTQPEIYYRRNISVPVSVVLPFFVGQPLLSFEEDEQCMHIFMSSCKRKSIAEAHKIE